MKDLNWEKRERKLQLGPQKRKLFISQLVRDVTVSDHIPNKYKCINHTIVIISTQYHGL